MPASMTDFRRVAHDVCNWDGGARPTNSGR